MIRLDRFLSRTATCTRSEASKACRKGQVTVDGLIVTESSTKVDETKCTVVYMGKTISWHEFTYVMLNKPRDTVSSTSDNGKTVMDILPKEFNKMGMYPCGRLDRDTVGLLLVTNDGPMTHVLLSPSHHVKKEYYFECWPEITDSMKKKIEKGIDIGGYVTKKAEISLEERKCAGVITISEGRFHQVKRMFKSAGSTITFLERKSFGPLVLDKKLERGKWRYLTEKEICMLREVCSEIDSQEVTNDRDQ